MRLGLALCACLLSTSSHALYRCEIDGKVEYRDLPCPAGKAAEVRVDPMRPTDGDARAARARAEQDRATLRDMDRRLEADRRAAARDRQAAALDAEQAKRQRVRCEQMARDLQWTAKTAAKYRGDEWWQNRVRARQENYHLDCR